MKYSLCCTVKITNTYTIDLTQENTSRVRDRARHDLALLWRSFLKRLLRLCRLAVRRNHIVGHIGAHAKVLDVLCCKQASPLLGVIARHTLWKLGRMLEWYKK